MRFETLADLQAERCVLLIQCQGCEQWSEKTVHQLNGMPWGPDLPPGELTVKITDIIAKLKCSRCGSKDVQWWPKRTGAALDDLRREKANQSQAAHPKSEPDP